ncbi:hypothetical protein QAD02_018555 [Eretmocerus hayati]|uniref:Uncharacterized protein n=1 Tax=Eretmocerus hayati TaxID=131215 RepID=A0ACC2PH16_9HYME|nr:hypothetical protein QAD02_018555 [Eretmocerus hayati]
MEASASSEKDELPKEEKSTSEKESVSCCMSTSDKDQNTCCLQTSSGSSEPVKSEVPISDSGQVKKGAEDDAVVVKAKPVRKIFKAPRRVNKIPQEILDDPDIQQAMSVLPSNYNFEIHKTIWRIREMQAKKVALQMPEGLLRFAMTLSDIITVFTKAQVIIMGDPTYGACCVEDEAAKMMNVDLLIHYGHSCLIPIDVTEVKMLYVFVDVKFRTSHCIETLKFNFPVTTRIGLISTIQFASSLQVIAAELRKEGYTIVIPQSKPLSPGEVLGCTAPRMKDVDLFVSVADGRFHLEAAMIANPKLPAYRYDPYTQKFTIEEYDHELMLKMRREAIAKARDAKYFGLIFGTLGRQGNHGVFDRLENRLKELNKDVTRMVATEIIPENLAKFVHIEAFIQVACPRLSIDWNHEFNKPVLTPYEAAVALNMIEMDEKEPYPMDYYAYGSLGPWTPNHKPSEMEKQKEFCCGKCKDEKNSDKPCK